MNLKTLNKFTISACLVCVMASTNVLAGEKDHDHNNQGPGYSGKTDISGKAEIKVNVKNVKNIIDGSDNTSIVRIGAIKQTKASGDVRIDLKDLGDVTNKAKGTGHILKTNIGTIENSQLGHKTTIKVKAKDVKNLIEDGKDNIAIVNMGTIEKSTIKGKADIKVEVDGEVKNRIHGGSDNMALLNVGGVKDATVRDVDINVHAKSIENNIKSGNKNTAEITMGFIE